MILSNVIAKGGLATGTGALVMTAAVTEIPKYHHWWDDPQAFKVGIWVIGLFLGVISFLMALLVYFIKSDRTRNQHSHELLFKKYDEVSETISELKGAHDAAMVARGCAYDPMRLQNMVAIAVKAALHNREHRADDPHTYDDVVIGGSN